MKRHLVLWSIGLALSASTASAQITLTLGAPNLHAGKVGVGIDGISGSPDLLLKYFLSNQIAGQLILGVDLEFPGGDPLPGQAKVTGIDLRGGVGLVFHLSQSQVSPYVGIEGIFESRKEGGFYTRQPDTKKIVTARALFGAEYYFNESISLGIKQALGGDFFLKRDVPKEETDVRFSTSTLLTGRFYFN
jgi:hypothetical protein